MHQLLSTLHIILLMGLVSGNEDRMFDNLLESTLEKTLSEILKLYDGHGGHVTVFDVDPLILEELKRRDYLNYLDFN